MRTKNTKDSVVLHITNSLGAGGAEATLYTLASHDSKSKHYVISLTDEGKYGPMLRSAGVAVTTLDMPRGKVTFRGLVRLFRLVRLTKPDVVQTWMYHADLLGGVVARLAGSSNISWGIRHSDLLPGESSLSTIFIAKINAYLSRIIPKTIVCCAEKALEVHSDLGYRRNKMVVIPNGYDLSVFKPNQKKGEGIRTELEQADDTIILGFVARFDPLEDHNTLLAALNIVNKEISNVHTILVGSNIDTSNKTLVAALESTNLINEVTLLGRRDDIPAIMNALDLHVMSSASEAFPNVLAEAMACGTPCVSTEVGDAGMIIGDTGWVVPPRNPQKLAGAILEALQEWKTGRWPVRQQRAVERIQQNFQIETMVSRYRTEAWHLANTTRE